MRRVAALLHGQEYVSHSDASHLQKMLHSICFSCPNGFSKQRLEGSQRLVERNKVFHPARFKEDSLEIKIVNHEQLVLLAIYLFTFNVLISLG
jgi:hypothetical protein